MAMDYKSGSGHTSPTYQSDVFFKYIQRRSPVTAKRVPAGEDWQHKIKFNGFRVQTHIIGKTLNSTAGWELQGYVPRPAYLAGRPGYCTVKREVGDTPEPLLERNLQLHAGEI